MKDDKVLIRHMLDAIGKIAGFIEGVSLEQFASSDMLLDAVVRECEIIGEAAQRVGSEAKEKVPAIPWSDIAGMRNRLIHEYFSVDEEVVWKTCKEDLPALKSDLERLLKELDASQ